MKNDDLWGIDKNQYSLHTTQDILLWLEERKDNLEVHLNRVSLEECTPWYYDEEKGEIRNRQGTFFQIIGVRHTGEDGTVTEQPIILQEEIGFLGIICCKINGVWHYLMQAKIEPGNVNCVQLSQIGRAHV